MSKTKSRKEIAEIYCSFALKSTSCLVVVKGNVRKLDPIIREYAARMNGKILFSPIRTMTAGYQIRFKSHRRMLDFANTVAGNVVRL